MQRITSFLRDEGAVTSHEYAVLLALIVVALLGVVQSLGTRHGSLWTDITVYLQSVGFFK